MRTLDRDYLATHPEGDEKAEADFSVAVPARFEVPDNADGTKPRILMKVEADTYLDMLAVLSNLHDETWASAIPFTMAQVCTPEEIDVISDEGPGAEDIMRRRFNEIVSPSRAFVMDVDMNASVDGKTVQESAVKITLTAPSVASGLQAAQYLSSPKMLQSAAIGFCPEIDDEYGDSNEVMVIQSKAGR